MDKLENGLHPCVVLLDPDTGLAPPKGKPGMQHVLDSELNYIWDKMSKRDVLVLYQHKTTRKKDKKWVRRKLAQFERVLALPRGTSKIATGAGAGIAEDVAFFYCRKETM